MGMSPTDREFLARFVACEFPKQEFHHAEHVRLAWILLSEAPLLDALLEFRRLLKAYAAHNGVPGLYNETITCFYMLLIRERMESIDANLGWEAFRAAQPELFSHPKALLERYYPGGTAFSPAAKQSFLLPESTAQAA
jgi:hypothetical protein